MIHYVVKKPFFFLIAFVSVVAANSYAGVPGFMKARMGTLSGQFYIAQDKPLVKGIVSFFNKDGGPPPIVGSTRRVPDMVSRTNGKGKFSVKLLPGKYYMGAMIRDAKDGPGPPREGEEYFFAMTKADALRVFKVKTKKTTDGGSILGTTPDKLPEFQRYAVIKGRIVDEKGEPLKGGIVTVKEKLADPRPKFIAKRVGANGKYELKLPAGRYYITARESLRRGRPRPGSLVGSYGKSGPSGGTDLVNTGGMPKAGGRDAGQAVALDAKEGRVYENIDITMFVIPDPDAIRIKYEAEARKRTIEPTNRRIDE